MIGNKKEHIVKKYDLNTFKWIDLKKIILSQWIRTKCMFGRKAFGSSPCPPNMPPFEECRNLLCEYNIGIIIHFDRDLIDPSHHRKWAKQNNLKLLEIEREVFLAGNPKVLMFFMSTCNFYDDCTINRSICQNPHLRRSAPEGWEIDD